MNLVYRYVTVLAIAILVLGQMAFISSPVLAQEQNNTASLQVVGKDQEDFLYKNETLTFQEGATAFDLLIQEMGKDQVAYQSTDFGKMITAIAGLQAEQGEAYWAFYINGKMAQVGSGQYQIQKGDHISFRYTFLKNTDDDKTNKQDKKEQEKQQPASQKDIQTAINQAIDYLSDDQVGAWVAVALRKAGKEVPAVYLEGLKQKVKKAKGQFKKITSYEKYTIGILAAGGDPTHFAGYNLVSSIYNGEISKQGINGVIYGLLALTSDDLQIPSNAKWDIDRMVQYLVDHQNEDGGWTGYNGKSSVDITAMAVTALSEFEKQAEVKKAVRAGVDFLAKQSSSLDNSTSTAQMIIALTANDIDPTEARFNKDERTNLVSYLLSFQYKSGGFSWKSADKVNAFSTKQPLEALVAADLFMNDDGPLYEFSTSKANKELASTNKSQDAASVKPGDDQKENPETGSTLYYWLIAAFVLLAIGFSIYLYGRRKKAKRR